MDEAASYLERFKHGDTEAMGELMELYRRPLFAFIIGMVPPSDAEDVFQEVWFKALKHLPRYRHDRFLSWLFRIARNLVIDRSRKRKPDLSLQDVLQQPGHAAGERADLVAAGGASPADLAGHADLAQRIQAAVQGLPAEQREVFLLRVEGDMPFKEIAAIQRTSINTALARMQYALTKLRQQLQDDYADQVTR